MVEYMYETKLYNEGICKLCGSEWIKKGTGYECKCRYKHFTFK